MTLHVDKNICIGCATCVSLSPNVYKMDADGKAIVTAPEGDTPENIDMSISACPVTAIFK